MDIDGEKFDLKVSIIDNLPQVIINNHIIDNKDIINVGEYGKYSLYNNYFLIKLYDSANLSRNIIIAIISIIISFTFSLSINLKKSIYLLGIPLSGFRIFKESKWRYGIYLIVILFFAIIPGCDAPIIMGSCYLGYKGVDIYQLQAVLNTIVQPEFLMFPYNYTLYLPYLLVSAPIFAFYNLISNVTYSYVLQILIYAIYRILNAMIMHIVICLVLGLCIESHYIVKSKFTKLYIYSFFNPVVFYVAIHFIQLDIVPVVCLVLGVIILVNSKKNILSAIISPILLVAAISMKTQIILMFPALVMLFIYCIIKDKKFKEINIKWYSYFVFFAIVSCIIFILPSFSGTALSVTLSNIPQSERAWYTTFVYSPGAVVYISIFMLVIFFILNVVHINLKMTKIDSALNCFILIGIISMCFSFSIISTPSSYLHIFPAILVLLIFTEDDWQCFMYTIFSFLIIMEEMFTNIGDITATLNYFNMTGIFTSLQMNLTESGEWVKVFNILFTLAKAGMFVYVLIFYNMGKKITKGNLKINEKQ